MRDGTGACPSLMRLISRSLIPLLCVLSLSRVWFFVAPRTVAPQAPLSMEVFKQEFWSRVPFPTPGDCPNPGIDPEYLASPVLAGGFLTTSATWESEPVSQLGPTL